MSRKPEPPPLPEPPRPAREVEERVRAKAKPPEFRANYEAKHNLKRSLKGQFRRRV